MELNFFNKDSIKEYFLDILINAEGFKINVYLLTDLKCKNIEYINTLLCTNNYIGQQELNDNWHFLYFIPETSSNKSYLLLGHNGYESLKNDINCDQIIVKPSSIINFWVDNINWENVDYNHHSIKWKKNCNIFNIFLNDLKYKGCKFIPYHWGEFHNHKQKLGGPHVNIWDDYYFFIKNNNLDNNDKNSKLNNKLDFLDLKKNK